MKNGRISAIECLFLKTERLKAFICPRNRIAQLKQLTVLRLQFAQLQTVCGVGIYNGFEKQFANIESVRMELANGESVVYSGDKLVWSVATMEDGTAVAGGSAMLQTIPMDVIAVEIVMPASNAQYAISEIAVMARR